LPKNPADQIEHELLLLKQKKNDLQKLAVLSINYGLCMFQTNWILWRFFHAWLFLCYFANMMYDWHHLIDLYETVVDDIDVW